MPFNKQNTLREASRVPGLPRNGAVVSAIFMTAITSTAAATTVGTGIALMSMCCARRWAFSRLPDTPSSIKFVPTSDGHRRADLHVVGTRLMGKDDLVVDATMRHDFTGDARDVRRHGMLRNPDRPDQLLDQAAADKIRNYREPYARNRSLAFLPACLSTSGRIHSEFLRLLYFIADKQASDYFMVLGYEVV